MALLKFIGFFIHFPLWQLESTRWVCPLDVVCGVLLWFGGLPYGVAELLAASLCCNGPISWKNNFDK